MMISASARAVVTTKPNSNVPRSMEIIRLANFRLIPLIVAIVMFGCSGGDSSNRTGSLQKAVDAADETAAIQTLRTIASAQLQAKAVRGSYADFNGSQRLNGRCFVR